MNPGTRTGAESRPSSAESAAGGLRPMTDADLPLVLSWRNLLEVRRNMFTTHEISWAEHSAWWEKVKADPLRRWYVYCEGGKPLGVVNYYDINQASGECYWGFYMGPSSSMGGRNRLSVWLDLEREAAAHAFSALACRRLLCETMAFNTPVLRIHEKFGFRKVKEFQRSRDGDPEGVILMALNATDFAKASAARTGGIPETAESKPVDPASPPRKAVRVAFLGSSNWDLIARDFASQYPALVKDTVEIVPVPFGQYRTCLFDESSALRASPVDFAIFCERFEDLFDTAFSVFDPSLGEAVVAHLEDYLSLVEKARTLLAGRFLVLDLAPLKPYSSSLQDAPYRSESQRGFVETLNLALRDRLEKLPDTHVLSLSSMLETFGSRNADPGKYWYLGRMAFSGSFGKFLNVRLIGAMMSMQGRTARAIVLDLDNTLWGGVIGDDGIQGIQLGTDFPGNVFLEFQNAALALKRRGIALAICSKNTEAVVVDAFDRHPGMRLKMSDFVAIRINWESKASNILGLAEELGLGLSSICFVDDSPYERDAVRRALPDLLVPEMPEDNSLWPAFLLGLPHFSFLRLTGEDLKRAEQYKTRAKINSDSRSFENKEAFWRSLEMKLYFHRLGDVNMKRTVQLLAKTNQFNATTRRHGEMDLSRLAAEGAEVIPIGLSDKYSRPEIIGVIILAYPESKANPVRIETFLLSCRVLGRSVETGILGWVGARTRARGYGLLEGEFIETPRNQPAAAVYPSHGFEPMGGGKYRLSLDGKAPKLPGWFQVEEEWK